MSILTDIIDAFDRFWDENAEKIVPILRVIAIILYFAVVGWLMMALFEIFIDCVPTNETMLGTVCRFRVN